MSGDNLPAALNRQVCPFEFCPDSALDVLIRNPVIMAVIGNSRRLEDPSRLLMHQDKVQLLPAEAEEALDVKIGRALFVNALMPMVEVIVVQLAEEGFIDFLNRRQTDVLQDEVSLDEPEQALGFAFCLRFQAVEKLDTELVGIPLIVGLSGTVRRLELGSPV